MSNQIISIITDLLQVFAISFILTLILSIFVGAVPFLTLMEQKNKRKSFNHVLKNGIAKKEITNSDLKHIAEGWNQDRKSILLSLRMLLSDTFSSKEGDPDNSKLYIRELLESHEKDEPFAELPENISLQLNSIQKALTGSETDKIDQLASSLSILYASNQKEILKQKFMTKASLFLGVLGILLALITYLPDLKIIL